ncbi:MAG: M20/M25/M40 family metallo-hydrolase, partial [Lachnospiraceae bacterium]|nr:M20/M25/M40 family metallo-hydrolase [Lachnospiraceae bacterium]
MGKLQNLYPPEVFGAFEEICGIPHGSYNIDEISDHLKACAEREGFECIQDKEKNILIRVPASPGYEDEEVLILQGHMDMVAVHRDKTVDMTKHVLEIAHDDEWVYAVDSSLGGDDGIAVAMMMAIMRDKTIKHPALELLITTNEEVGMDGAVGLDTSMLKGKRLLNLDSEDEGIFTVGCAGGVRVVAHYPFNTNEKLAYKARRAYIYIKGLKGGHSGQMIHKGRANACRIAARILYGLSDFGVALKCIDGGTAANAIPCEARAEIAIPSDKISDISAVFASLKKDILHEYHGKDDDMQLELEITDEEMISAAAPEQTKQFAA